MEPVNTDVIVRRLNRELRTIVVNTLNQYDGREKDLEAVMLRTVKSRMSTYVRKPMFLSEAVNYSNYRIQNSFCQTNCCQGRIIGTVTLEHQEKKDTLKYGGPGFKGNENGEVCQYPDYGSKYYQWDALRCRWRD